MLALTRLVMVGVAVAGQGRYQAGALGITPHRDSKHYRLLIAIFTTEGSARFTHCVNREGEIVDQWQTRPGSLILMRGQASTAWRTAVPSIPSQGQRPEPACR